MILIVGAGPAGLSTAYHLRDSDYLVLEKEAEPGGLCRSFELGGAVFDLGGHAFFTRHEYVRSLVTRLCPPGLYTQPRQAWVYSHGTYVPYPFQSHLHGLPSEVVEECLVGLYEAVARQHRQAVPGNVREWIDLSFGPGIGRQFLLPYNEKIWAHPLDQVSPEWTSNRIVTPDVRTIVAGALRPRRSTAFPNATVSYPAAGGFFELYRGFLDAVGDRLTHGTVSAVDLRRRAVHTADGRRVGYDALVSTMPLDELVTRSDGVGTCCRRAAATLRHNSLYLVNLVVDRPAITPMQRIYAAAPEVPFHKLVLNSNSSDELRSRPAFGIQAEVSWSAHKHVDQAGLERRVLTALHEMGLLAADDRVTASSVVTVDRAYPVHTADTTAAREHLLDCFQRVGVHCAGRFGEWLYINSDDAVMRGRSRAEELNALLGAA